MKTVLILGGTGAMGGYLVDILSQKPDHAVFVTSRSARADLGNVRYLLGNARDRAFMHDVLKDRFDVIVDFMNYGYDEFMACHHELLSATDHYVFLSSSRVYDFSDRPLVESSPRLLDATADQAFLATQRYALRKARQENMLKESGKTNYTVIRPYITYSDRRLQLGIYEKEQWLYRVLNDKPVVIREEILSKRTTLTYGRDVSLVLSRVIDSEPLAGPVHITTEETMTWGDILRLYSAVITEETGKEMKVYTTASMPAIEELFEGGYNTRYDRLFDRSFDHSLAETRYGTVDYMGMKQGLAECLRAFVRDWKTQGNALFLPILWDYEALMDSMLSIETIMPEMNEQDKALYRATVANGRKCFDRAGLSVWSAD